MRPLLLLCALVSFPALLFALPPPWWTEAPTRIIDPQAAPAPLSPVNLGQLKHVAAQAKKHLDTVYGSYGGAGSEIDALVAAFSRDASTNAAPALLGQIKAVAKPFYTRLQAIGYDTRQNLIARGYPATWAHPTPWDPAATSETAQNNALTTLGQLKMVFSFDISADSDMDGLPTAWELAAGSNPNDPNPPTNDRDDDGLSDFEEYQLGTNPNVKDTDLDGIEDGDEVTNGTNPRVPDAPPLTIRIANGSNQNVLVGTYAHEQLIIEIANSSGSYVQGVEVQFEVLLGRGQLQKDVYSPLVSIISMITGADGRARVDFLSPSTQGVCTVRARPLTGGAADVTFNLTATVPATPRPIPANAPIGVTSIPQPDGSITITWIDSPDETEYYVLQQQADGSWKEISGRLNANVTSFTIAPPPPTSPNP